MSSWSNLHIHTQRKVAFLRGKKCFREWNMTEAEDTRRQYSSQGRGKTRLIVGDLKTCVSADRKGEKKGRTFVSTNRNNHNVWNRANVFGFTVQAQENSDHKKKNHCCRQGAKGKQKDTPTSFQPQCHTINPDKGSTRVVVSTQQENTKR